MRRAGNNPKRRVVAVDMSTQQIRLQLEQRVRYVGSGHHKRNPADYGFERTNPRPTKSLCDMERIIHLPEATSLLLIGIKLGMFSELQNDGYPKFIWAVSEDGSTFEAKTDVHGTGEYHGYPLSSSDPMHHYIKKVWEERCKRLGQ